MVPIRGKDFRLVELSTWSMLRYKDTQMAKASLSWFNECDMSIWKKHTHTWCTTGDEIGS